MATLCWTFIGSAVLCYAHAAHVILCAIGLSSKILIGPSVLCHAYAILYQGETWEGPRRCFTWNAFPTPYSNANWIHFWAGGTT